MNATHVMPSRVMLPSIVIAFFFRAEGFAFQELVNSVDVYVCVTLMRCQLGGGTSEIEMR